MKKTRQHIFLLTVAALALSACKNTSMFDTLPDRRLDYRQSSISRKIEVPPDLSAGRLDDELAVSDFDLSLPTNYSSYEKARVQRNNKGFIKVLPPLYKVAVKQPRGEAPYLLIEADVETTWQAVKKYWQYNGGTLSVEEPKVGIMETEWLKNEKDTPQTGIGGILDGFLGFLSDDDERDRYRLRFTRLEAKRTQVLLLARHVEQVADHDFQSGKEPAGFKWQHSSQGNRERQLEMTRRIALFVSSELKRHSGASTQAAAVIDKETQPPPSDAADTTTLLQLGDGRPALILPAPYAQAWRVLGIGLDKASFTIIEDDYQTGTYHVRYTPQSDAAAPSLFSRLVKSPHGSATTERPGYLVRLADQDERPIAVVQNADGTAAQPAKARALLEAVQAAL